LFVIPAKAGLKRQEAGTNIRVANGPEGVRQEPHRIQLLLLGKKEKAGFRLSPE